MKTARYLAGDNEEVSSRKCSLLHDIANTSVGDVTSEEKNRLYKVLIESADVVAENSDMARCCKHSIDTGNYPPPARPPPPPPPLPPPTSVRQQCRRVPPFRREQAKEIIDDMIRRISSNHRHVRELLQ